MMKESGRKRGDGPVSNDRGAMTLLEAYRLWRERHGGSAEHAHSSSRGVEREEED